MKHLLWLSLLGVLLASCSAAEQQGGGGMPVKGKAMPKFQMTTLDGKQVNSHAQFAGKVIILNVWATWCPPCRKEMPDLIRLSRLLPANKFKVIGLSVDSNADDVRTFIKEHHIPFPVYWDQGGQQVAGPILSTFKYPETYVINRRGLLVDKVIGAFPWASPQMVEVLNYIYKTGHAPASDKKEKTK
jgi:thiol-disulfide isomerase/thioredoxin